MNETSRITMATLSSDPYDGQRLFGQLKENSLFVGMGVSN
jgi:hypothetical protein